MLRSLIHHWRAYLAVAAGSAVATAVLAGALVVGDSVRGSLRDLVLDRLGSIHDVVVAESPFREALAGDLAGALAADGVVARTAPALVLRGSAVHGASRARASSVAVLGVDERFAALYPDPAELDFDAEGLLYPPIVLNRALAGELGAAAGDPVLISFERPSDIPRETVVGRREAVETVETLRFSVAAVMPERGAGGFSLALEQARPLNAFVELARLQRRLAGRGGARPANLLAIADAPMPAGDSGAAALRSAIQLEDLGLVLEEDGGALRLGSRRFVLDPALSAPALEAARALGAAAQPVLTYLATSLRTGGREVPYSTVSALDPPADPALGALRLTDGRPAPALADDEILLNAWTAEDLEAEPGAVIELDYYELGPRDELSIVTARFRLAGVVAMEGLGADPTLTPEFPGIEDADDMSSWNPPFPVDLERVRRRDEDYWDTYRSSPKAFVSEAAGRRLWRSRFGDLTSIRLAAAGSEGDGFAAAYRRELVSRLDPRAAGLGLRPLRAEGLESARGATDFAQLFLGLSMFLIASAALLVGLLFRLATERRAREVGLLRAVGFRARSVRNRLLGEGTLVAAAGAVAGLGGAIGYAWAMLAGLRGWWLPAVGTPMLFLHVEPASLAIGWAASLVVVVLTIAWTLRRLGRIPPPRLLAGAVGEGGGASRPRRALPVAGGGVAVAALLVAAAVATGATSSPGYAFGIGACLLVAGLAAFAHLAGGGRPGSENEITSRRGGAAGGAVLGMGARNTGRNRTRSVSSVALVASASFLIVVVAANRAAEEPDVTDPASGAGGFTLLAESEVPIVPDLGSPERRSDLGFAAESESVLDGVEIVPFRLRPGEDVSCLNLYRPQRPRVLGVPPEMVERGGFSFRATSEPADHPWTLLERPLEPGVVPAFGDYNSVLWILHLGLGDDLVIEDDAGREVKLRLVGLLEKSLFQSEILISEARFLELFPERAGAAYFLADPAPEAVPRVAEALEAALGRFGFDATPTAERLAAFRAVENTYLATFQTLGGLGLLLGTLGLGVVMLRNVLERRGELATLRAFGFRRSTLAWMVLAENGVLLAAGIPIGAVAGLVASAPHLAAAGAGVPWGSLAATLGVVFVVGALSGAAAVAGSLRVPLLPALKAE